MYGDRLVDVADINWLVELVRKVLANQMDEDMNALFSDYISEKSDNGV